MNKIVYFSAAQDALVYAQTLTGQGFACLMDSPLDAALFTASPALDSEETEQAISFLFDRLEVCGEFEAAAMRAQLFTHYPRVYRGLVAAGALQGRSTAYFIPKDRLSIYDLAFAHASPCEFEILEGNAIKPAALERIVEFYEDTQPERSHQAPELLNKLVAWGNRWARRGAKFSSRAPKVLFIAHDNETNLYLRPLVSVFTELRQRGVGFEVVSCDDRARNFLLQESEPFVDISTMHAQAAPGPEEAAAMARWFTQRIQENPVDSGNALYDAMFRLAMNSAVRRDIWDTRQMAHGLVRYILATGVTDVFLAPDGTPIAAQVHKTLKKAHIRLHTLVAAGVSRFKRGVPYYFADTVYCAGNDAREAILHHFPSRQVIAVGNPVLHRYMSQGNAAVDAGSRRCVLIGTSGFDPNESRWMAALAERIDASRYLLILKPHPSHAQRYDALAQAFAKHRIASASMPIEPLVNAADVILTDHSQVGIDAHLLGKPVVSMYCGPGDILYMQGIRSIRYVRTVDALLAAIEASNASSAAPSQEFVAAFNTPGDSFYYRRIADTIAKPS